MNLELISFELCPYVQRSVITLKYKGVPFKTTLIDLENPPHWFDKISPMGKVPVLKVNNEVALFESAVINEYIDETVGIPLHPKDPLQRAFERAWIEFGSELLKSMYEMTLETDRSELEKKKSEFFVDLKRLEQPVSKEGPYFRGKEFSLVDTSFAPLFQRMMLSKTIADAAEWRLMPQVQNWVTSLIKMPIVEESVPEKFEQKYIASCKEMGSLLYG